MGAEKIKYKSLINSMDNINNELILVNKHTVKPLTEDEVYLFQIELCDNDIDRVGDKMSDDFLEQVANNVNGLTGLKDHDWSSDNQLARLYNAEVKTDETKVTKLGEPRKYVLGKAYTLSKYKDYIDKINAGLLKECSISFESEGDTCSICGSPMIKNKSDIGQCENGHIAGTEVDGILCYNNINKLTDTLEWSLVAVPCQHNAGIKNKNKTGGKKMSKAELILKRLMSSKAYKDLEQKDKVELEETLKEDITSELSDEDIRKLVEENTKLKEQIEDLKLKVSDAENGRVKDRIEAIVEKAVDEMNPVTPKVKEMFMKDIPWDDLKLEDGQIPGLDDVFAGMKEEYKGLFVNEEDIEKVGGHEEPDGDELAVVSEEDLNKSEPDEDEGKVMVTKGYTRKGITLGVSTCNNKVNKVQSNKSGITWSNK